MDVTLCHHYIFSQKGRNVFFILQETNTVTQTQSQNNHMMINRDLNYVMDK